MACCFKHTVGDDDRPGSIAGKYAEDKAPAGHVKRDHELKMKKSLNARPARNSNGAAHSGRAARLSTGDSDDEWHDAEDTMPSLDPTWANSPSSKEIGSILEEHGIALEVREAPAEGIGRCLIPRFDIPFEKPGEGGALSWSANPLGQGFRLRGKQYKKDRKKYPSEKPLYDVVHVLAFRSDVMKMDFGGPSLRRRRRGGDPRVPDGVHREPHAARLPTAEPAVGQEGEGRSGRSRAAHSRGGEDDGGDASRAGALRRRRGQDGAGGWSDGAAFQGGAARSKRHGPAPPPRAREALHEDGVHGGGWAGVAPDGGARSHRAG